MENKTNKKKDFRTKLKEKVKRIRRRVKRMYLEMIVNMNS